MSGSDCVWLVIGSLKGVIVPRSRHYNDIHCKERNEHALQVLEYIIIIYLYYYINKWVQYIFGCSRIFACVCVHAECYHMHAICQMPLFSHFQLLPKLPVCGTTLLHMFIRLMLLYYVEPYCS